MASLLFSQTAMPRLSFGGGSLDDLSALESRRQTFVQAGGGDVLSQFMAQHEAAEAEAEEEALTATAVTARKKSKIAASTESGSVTERRTTRARAAATTKSTSGRPPLPPSAAASRQAKLAEWKNAQPAAPTSTAGKENRFAATSLSPLPSKRKSMGLTQAAPTNNKPLAPTSSTVKKPRMSTGVTSRASMAPPASPRSAAAGIKRKSMMPLATVPEAAPIALPIASLASVQSTQDAKAWQTTAHWRMVLLRVQRAALQSSSAQLEQAQLAHQSVLSELATTQSTLAASSRREQSLGTQLATSVNSESMLRLAAEELGHKVEELTHTVASNKAEYEMELAQVREALATRSSTAEELEAEVATLSSSEASLRAQLAATIQQLAVVNEQRYADEVARKKLHSTIQDLKGSIRVFCRVRPAAVAMEDVDESQEQPQFTRSASTTDHGVGGALSNFTEDLVVVAPSGALKLDGSAARSASYNFNFDRVFQADSTQAELFAELDELLVSAMDGTSNVSVMAYGATGSGKTHTMLGEGRGEEAGMIPRAIDRLMEYARNAEERQWTYTFKASLLEIYNDIPVDLLAAKSSTTKEVKIQADKNGRVIVSGLEVFPVTNAAEVHALLDAGSKQRSVASTACNARSSRSHTVFQLAIEGSNARTGESLSSRVNLVDLAGSERLDASKAASNPALLKETQHINSSLSSLVSCMSAIASRATHIPYRNSALTHLLAESLGKGAGGVQARTLFFVNLAPEAASFPETLCTLRFAEKLKAVEMNSTPAGDQATNKRPKRK